MVADVNTAIAKEAFDFSSTLTEDIEDTRNDLLQYLATGDARNFPFIHIQIYSLEQNNNISIFTTKNPRNIFLSPFLLIICAPVLFSILIGLRSKISYFASKRMRPSSQQRSFLHKLLKYL